MEDDWDLHAVVRGCAALATTTSSAAATTTSVATSQNFSTFQDLIEPRRERFVEEELHELYKPFFSKSLESSQLQFSLPILPPAEQVTKQLPLQRQKLPSFSVSGVPKAHNSIPRSKRRKNHLKRVCHVAAENLSSDMWSWRKYGQKPIKGSPYPRGYYRCSTSKGCMARKQVERNRSDPGMFIVTYTAEHNHAMPTHRNSLAGSTRQKPDDPGKASFSPELSVSAVPEKLESSREDLADAEDDDDDLSVSKTEVDDDFFAGLEDFTGPDGGDHTSANLQFPWLSSGAATIAGGG